MPPPRSLDPAEGLRALRWVGRVITIAALWPTWYAWFGKLEFDWEAMMVGGPGLAIGLALWLGAGHRLRHPKAGGAAPTRGAMTIGDQLAAPIDAAILGLAGKPGIVVMALASIAWTLAAWPHLATTADPQAEAAIVFGVFAAMLALGWRMIARPVVAIASALLGGLALASKPWWAPVEVEFMGQLHALSPSAETHLYYLVPGLALIGLAVVALLNTELAGSKPASEAAEPVELAPPRPKFPRPPTQP
ncbi:hypothetical protein ACNOYE_35070 [Nannocystaceae bacterium ST9]